MMEPTSYSADTALAEALAKLQALEQDNTVLRSRLSQLSQDAGTINRAEKWGWGSRGAGGGGEGEGKKEAEILHKQLKELMHVNNQWDLEYKELEAAFSRYRMDSQQAQAENQTVIEKLKEAKESMAEEIRTLQTVISRKDKDVTELRGKVRSLEEQLGGSRFRYGQPMVSHERLKELEEESHILRQQLKAYQDDFNAERRDRERMNEQRESAAIRYEAEVTSLKLQLERCRNELAHYTSEANRLSQQLRLKCQMEEDQYKRHLENNGYITRSPSGRLPSTSQLPPLDPFVENDPKPAVPNGPTPPPPSSVTPPRNPSPRLLTRGVDLVQAFSTSQSNSHSSQNSNGTSSSSGYSTSNGGSHVQNGVSRTDSGDSDRSRSPVMLNGNSSNYHNGNSSSTRRPVSPFAMATTASTSSSNYSSAAPTRASTNGRVSPIPPSIANGSSNANYSPQKYNAGTVSGHGHMTNGDIVENGVNTATRGGVRSNSPFQQQKYQNCISRGGVVPPPLQTTGRYSCPRCNRKFEHDRDCTDHKLRCMV